MKWVLLTEDAKVISPQFMREEPDKSAPKSKMATAGLSKDFFTSFKHEKEIIGKSTGNAKSKSPAASKFTIWAAYPFDPVLYPLTHANMSRYELFCSGWLHFYDMILRGGSVDHTIYFKWEKKKVTIYITPPAGDVKERALMGKSVGADLVRLIVSKDPPQPPAPPPPPM